MNVQPHFSVLVSNIGHVYRGPEHLARREFNEYIKLCKAKVGRAAGENATLFDSAGEIVREYRGRLSRIDH